MLIETIQETETAKPIIRHTSGKYSFHHNLHRWPAPACVCGWRNVRWCCVHWVMMHLSSCGDDIRHIYLPSRPRESRQPWAHSRCYIDRLIRWIRTGRRGSHMVSHVINIYQRGSVAMLPWLFVSGYSTTNYIRSSGHMLRMEWKQLGWAHKNGLQEVRSYSN